VSERTTMVNCESCGKEIEDKNHTIGCQYWCRQCLEEGKATIAIDYCNPKPTVMVSGDWQKRAIKAEAENQRLRELMVDAIEHCETCRGETYMPRRCARCQTFADTLKEATP